MAFSVRILKRDFSAPLNLDGLALRVISYSFHEEGGPEQADLEALGGRDDLWELVELLRCPIEIMDEEEEVVWWGFLSQAEIHDGVMVDAVSLDEMFNRLAEASTLSIPGVSTPGDRFTTAWAEDADSIAAYGTKEILLSLPSATEAEAENARDYELTQRKYPIPVTTVGNQIVEPPYGRLVCRGWWDTLDWVYFGRAAGLEQNAETQGDVNLGGPTETVIGTSHITLSGTQAFGNAGATEKLEGSFSLPANLKITDLAVQIQTNGTPLDEVFLKLYDNAAGVPGSLLATATISTGTITSALEWVTETLVMEEVGHETSDGTQAFGNAGATTKLETSFTSLPALQEVTELVIKIRTEGAPADNVLVKLYSDSAGVPNTLLGTATLASSEIGASLSQVTFTLASAVNLLAATTYHLEVSRSGANDGANYYVVSVDEGLGFAGGVLQIWDGGAWVARSPDADLFFQVIGDVTVPASTTYHLEISRSGANDAVNYYTVSVDEGLGYTSGQFKIWNGAAWVARSPNADLAFRVWGEGVYTKIEQAFQLTGGEAWQASNVQIYAHAEGSPADHLRVRLYTDSSGAPGSLLATGTFAGSDVPPGAAWLTFALDAEVALSLATTYHLQVDRTGATDATNYYVVGVDEGLHYASYVMKVWNGSAWVRRAEDADLAFVIGGVEETTTQIETALASAEFITDVEIKQASGVNTSPYRNGDQRLLDVVRELLKAGISGGARLLATVTKDRIVQLAQAPEKTAYAYLINRRGEISTATDGPVDLQKCPVAVWMRRTDIPGEANTERLVDLSKFYVEAAEFSVANGYTPTPRGAQRPFELPGQVSL